MNLLSKNFSENLIILVLSILFISSCGKNDLSSKLNVVTQRTITLDSTAAQHLGNVYPFIASSPSEEYLALSNVKNPVGVVVVDYEGNFVAQYGSRGRGPKEILSARFFGFDNNNHVNIYDKSLALIKEFKSSTDSVKSYQPPIKSNVNISSRLLEQCNSSWIAGVTQLDENYRTKKKSAIIGIFNEEFKLKELFGSMDPYMEGHNSILSPTITSVDCENELVYTSHEKIPFIQIYDLNTQSRVGRIEHVPPSFKLSDQFLEIAGNMQNVRDFLINEQSSSIFLAHTKDYIVLPFRNETSDFFITRNFNDREHFLAVFSKEDYKFIDEIPIDGAPLGRTKEGYIITLVNRNPDNFQIKFLKIQEQEGNSSS